MLWQKVKYECGPIKKTEVGLDTLHMHTLPIMTVGAFDIYI